ncbi:hypothetical protein BUALT_Bualt04G0082100 [Buddleja alternifolia]|uniref:Myb/SANT-like domain-containing protein n=1 Tax=Buddleja alternifolia TaxID=168488 RepID=A0AAV6XVF1_9LAMI|nr:hypothetical protein BUALT_Bualt04G0082100 [Buddleja alternifolia]
MNTFTQYIRGPGKNKRKWKYEEDAKLIDALLDMVNLGTYKAENRFKPGYLNYVEEKLQVSLRNSCLKAKLHIESRIKTMKKDFTTVYDMLNSPNTSGFSWDPIKKCITVEKPVWDDIFRVIHHIQVGRISHSLSMKICLLFSENIELPGTNVEGPADMMDEIQREQANNNTNNDVEKHGLEDIDASMLFSPMQSRRIIGNEIAKASEVFSKAIEIDAEISEKRQKIDLEIRKIHHLTTREIIKVVCHVARDHELTDVFFSSQ